MDHLIHISNFRNHKTKPPKEDEDDHIHDENEDALSLSDFPLKASSDKRNSSDKRRSSSEPSEFFEFFNDFTTPAEMSHAEDIIFCGKLVPYRNQHQILKSLSADDATRFSRRGDRRSPIELHPTTISSGARAPRNRHATDRMTSCRRRWDLVRSDADVDIRRSFSKSSARSEGSSRASRPRWFVLMSGPLKLIQPEIDLRDIKSRRGRRRPGSMFPSTDTTGGKIPARRKSFWGFDLLRVLSCKSHASVAVTASREASRRNS